MQAKGIWPRTLLALGVVYGDIGTSPLYALRACFGELTLDPEHLLGVLSLIVWSLILVVTVKYVTFIMRADNRGEGGILALTALAEEPPSGALLRPLTPVVALGLFGAALLYGDGIITPAISVLSAVEGLEVVFPAAKPFVVLIAALIIIALFVMQGLGTHRIGNLFGPIMLLWFATLAALGAVSLFHNPDVLYALDPRHALRFLTMPGMTKFVVLGSVVLSVTGVEALYADMGHFGAAPIQRGWLLLVLPALTLNYFGQGALLLRDPAAIENPFFLLAPESLQMPLILLATVSTVIASQAMLTGAFSLSHQAVQLGYLPRLRTKYTSEHAMGQIYLPTVNWLLLVGTLYLVLEFRSSSALAGAYGIAVTGTMLITTLLVYKVARLRWGWSPALAASVTSFFLIIDLAFFGANLLKILHGGWLPLVLAVAIFSLMTTWHRGRELVLEQIQRAFVPLKEFLQTRVPTATCRVPGTAVFLTQTPDIAPPSLVHHLKHNKVLHNTVILMRLETVEVPHYTEKRTTVEPLGAAFFQANARYGFMEVPSVPEVMEACRVAGVPLTPDDTTYFLTRQSFLSNRPHGMAVWRERLFAFLARNSQRASSYFRVPSTQVIELGIVLDI